MVAGVLIVAAVAVFFLTVWYMQSARKRALINKLPGPPALPLIGNSHQLSPRGSDFYAQIMKYAEENKDAGCFRLWLGTTPIVATYRAELSEVILNTTKHLDKSLFYQFLHPWLGTGLLTSTGTKWHGRRKLLTPTFHFKILTDFLTVFDEQSKILTEKLRSRVGGEKFNIFPYLTLCALDIISETAMGKKLNAQNDSDSEYVQTVYKMTSVVMNRMKAPWFWPDFVFNTLGNGTEHSRYLQILHDFTEKVIEQKRRELAKTDNKEAPSGGKKRLAFMDMLLHMANDGATLSNEDIREEVDTFMFEGHDTTAAAMNWVTYLIGYHKDVQRKVQEEVDAVFGDSDRSVTVDDLKELKYLECCVKEALRLYPSVPMFGRCLTEDTIMDGKVVPKDTTFLVLSSALHRDPKVFPDPEKFDPDRFLPENVKDRHPFSYIPFSAGMRNCIGQKFAMMEEKTVLSYIFRNFNVKTHQKREELNPVGDLILRPEDGIIVSLTYRK